MTDLIAISMACLLISQEASKYRLTAFKPLNCEYCLTLWATLAYLTTLQMAGINQYGWTLLIIYSFANSFFAKLVAGIYLRYVGYFGK